MTEPTKKRKRVEAFDERFNTAERTDEEVLGISIIFL